jgi:hypothetical protein
MKSMKKELLAAAAAAALVVGGTHVWAQSGGAAGDTQLQGRSGAQNAPNATGTQQPGGAAAQGGAQVQGQGDMKTKPGSAQMKTEGGAKTGTQAQGAGKQGGSQEQSQQSQESGKDAKRPGQAQQPSGDAKKQQSTESKPGSTEKAAQLSSEQRTKISSTIKSKDVNLKRVERTNINFNINVGTVVPRTIGLVPLPAPIVAVVPAYRGYLYIVVGDDLLIVHPSTYEIVAVIPA